MLTRAKRQYETKRQGFIVCLRFFTNIIDREDRMNEKGSEKKIERRRGKEEERRRVWGEIELLFHIQRFVQKRVTKR